MFEKEPHPNGTPMQPENDRLITMEEAARITRAEIQEAALRLIFGDKEYAVERSGSTLKVRQVHKSIVLPPLVRIHPDKTEIAPNFQFRGLTADDAWQIIHEADKLADEVLEGVFGEQNKAKKME